MPREIYDEYEWLYDGEDLPPDQKALAVAHTLDRLRLEIRDKQLIKPAIGVDERRPGFVVCQGLTKNGPFNFATPLAEILESSISRNT